MRDINRIDIICDKLREIWKRSPDLRLGQLLCCIMGMNGALFIVEDDMLLNKMERWEEERSRRADRLNELRRRKP